MQRDCDFRLVLMFAIVVTIVTAGAGADLLLQAPLVGLVLSVVAVAWCGGALAWRLVWRRGAAAKAGALTAPTVLFCAYFVSVSAGLSVSQLVTHEARQLREHLLQRSAQGAAAKHAAYAAFCASRMNGRCGWLNYRIDYMPDVLPPGADRPGTLVVHQFFSERVGIALDSGRPTERRVVD